MNTVTSQKKYYPELDIIKGIAILTVIFQHTESAEFQIPEWLDYFLHIFSMPLFMMASGFLYSTKGTWTDFLIKKGKRLLIPYFCFGIIAILMQVSMGHMRGASVSEICIAFLRLFIGDQYWFLYALFLFMFVCKLIKTTWLLVAIAIISMVGSYFTDGLPLIATRLIVYPFYFIIGMAFRYHYPFFVKMFDKHRMLIPLVVYTLFLITFTPLFRVLEIRHIAELTGCLAMWVTSLLFVMGGVKCLYCLHTLENTRYNII